MGARPPGAETAAVQGKATNSPTPGPAGSGKAPSHAASGDDPADGNAASARAERGGSSPNTPTDGASDSPTPAGPVLILAPPGEDSLVETIGSVLPGKPKLLPPTRDTDLNLKYCYVFYPEESLPAEAQNLARKLDRTHSCDQPWRLAPFGGRRKLKDYVETQAGGPALLIAITTENSGTRRKKPHEVSPTH